MVKSTYKQAADLFHLLAHPARLRILDELRRAQACVCHLQTVLRRPQAYISQQLRVLREAEVVSAEREGLNVYYRITHAQVLNLLNELLGPGGEPTRLPHCPYCARAEGTRAEYEQFDPHRRHVSRRGDTQQRAQGGRAMSQVRIEAFVSVPPCSGGVAVKRLLKEIEAAYGDRVEIVTQTGPGDPEWEAYAISNAPALVVGDLTKFVGLAPSRESLVGALREAGME